MNTNEDLIKDVIVNNRTTDDGSKFKLQLEADGTLHIKGSVSIAEMCALLEEMCELSPRYREAVFRVGVSLSLEP